MGEDFANMEENSVKPDGESLRTLKQDTQMTLYFLLICIVLGKLRFLLNNPAFWPNFLKHFLGVGGALLLEKLVAIRKRRMNDRLENQAKSIIALTQRISHTMPTAPNLNEIQNAIWSGFKLRFKPKFLLPDFANFHNFQFYYEVYFK